jgi:hypothetical protein
MRYSGRPSLLNPPEPTITEANRNTTQRPVGRSARQTFWPAHGLVSDQISDQDVSERRGAPGVSRVTPAGPLGETRRNGTRRHSLDMVLSAHNPEVAGSIMPPLPTCQRARGPFPMGVGLLLWSPRLLQTGSGIAARTSVVNASRSTPGGHCGSAPLRSAGPSGIRSASPGARTGRPRAGRGRHRCRPAAAPR